MNANLKLSLAILSLLLYSVFTVEAADTLRGDNHHSRTWNKFADDVLALHNKIKKEKRLKEFSRTGGYFGNPDFYIEETFTDLDNGNVVSRVLWERENPENLHSIEVFILDKEGRVTRDYAAAYLPAYRNAPTQTLISLYAYNGDLTAYRTFDATGDRIGERCEGKLKGKEVNFLLDEDELIDAIHGNSNRMEQPDYIACFKGMSEVLGKYKKPQ